MKCVLVVLAAMTVAAAYVHLPHDPYHALHLPGAYRHYKLQAHRLTGASAGCAGRHRGHYADVQSGCEKYYECRNEQVISVQQCVEGTLFNEQFEVCDHFYNVRCGSPYEDL